MKILIRSILKAMFGVLDQHRDSMIQMINGIQAGSLPTGTVIAFANSEIDGFIRCDGKTYNSADYPVLSPILAGANATEFTVPNIAPIYEIIPATEDFSLVSGTVATQTNQINYFIKT